MRVSFHRTSDTTAVSVDGKTRYVFDDNELDAFRKILDGYAAMTRSSSSVS